MIFTLYYMYATFLQWWRLGSLKNKLTGTFNAHNALLICDENTIYDTKRSRSFENLLFRNDERIGCTVVPRQKINLAYWVNFPRDYRYFPIYFRNHSPKIASPNIYILIQAVLDTYVKHSADLLEIENFGELVAWRVSDYFEAILKTDLDKLTKLVHCFSQSNIDINHELKLVKLETVDVEGNPTKIKYDKKFSKDIVLKYSHAPVYWRKFADTVKQLYSKIRDTTNPKITIENGKSEDIRKVPVSEVKPIKKDSRKHEDRNTLEVAPGDYRRHKSSEHKKEKHRDSSKNEKKPAREPRRDHHKKDDSKTRTSKSKSAERDSSDMVESTSKEHSYKKLMNEKSKTDLEQPSNGKAMTKRTSSSEKKLVKSLAVDEAETEPKHKIAKPGRQEIFTNGQIRSRLHVEGNFIKPPNVLIYADSPIAKDNVKSALTCMLNKEKYIIYDLPTDPNQTAWITSAILVVVCGTVPPNLTFNLLEYLLHGGQLLCLCSDLLYSVLHTFTTAEVREHELVRFSYDKWKQVKMMHHIFCYQASPAKKQFSRDSDHSNQSSSNGSSPIAPRTPSTAELQHNGKDYTMQVQVLGTEETWQTPSLLLASVKGGEGRAIFSQVHLEINPNQYEDDESKYEALKESDQARLEILKDILITHLEVDCSAVPELGDYTPAYFLGRHETKMKLLTECDNIKNNLLECEKITVKFYGKDEDPDRVTEDFLPIFIHSCPAHFSTVNYFEALETEHIGRLVIYCDVLSYSLRIFNKSLIHGLAIIPRAQSQAIGRSNNAWISPVGSSNFCLQLHVQLSTPLGRLLPLIQHLAIVGIISALKKIPGCKELDIGLKWPNDLYAYGTAKLGGVMINSSIMGDIAIVNIGCGMNLNNSNPTTCINDVIKRLNDTKGTSVKPISYECYYALIFNEMERIYNIVQAGNINYLFDLYYKYWLHNESEVTVTNKFGYSEKMRIVGIDDYGYLKVRSEEGKISTVQPDGNSFDMLKGLIFPKVF